MYNGGGHRVPDFLVSDIGTQAVKNSIASKKNEVVSLLLYVDVMYFGVYNYNIRIAIVLLNFSLAIAKSSRDRESAWNDTNWSTCNWSTWPCQHDILILVYLTTCLQYPFLFSVLGRLVII